MKRNTLEAHWNIQPNILCEVEAEGLAEKVENHKTRAMYCFLTTQII